MSKAIMKNIPIGLHKDTQKYIHRESKLTFRSKDDKVVDGRIEGTQFVPFDQVALDLCTKYGFPFDETCVQSSTEEEEEPQVEVEQEEMIDAFQPEEETQEVIEIKQPEPEPEVKIVKTAKVEKETKSTVPKPVPSVVSQTLTSDLGSLASLKPLLTAIEVFVSSRDQAQEKEKTELQVSLTSEREAVALLREERGKTKEELEKTKKKLKSVLLSMSDGL